MYPHSRRVGDGLDLWMGGANQAGLHPKVENHCQRGAGKVHPFNWQLKTTTKVPLGLGDSRPTVFGVLRREVHTSWCMITVVATRSGQLNCHEINNYLIILQLQLVSSTVCTANMYEHRSLICGIKLTATCFVSTFSIFQGS